MYRFKFPLLGCFLTLSSIFTAFAPARALDFTFSFTGLNEEVPGVTLVPGTVSGRILGLANNTSNQAASQVIIDLYPSDLGTLDQGPIATSWANVGTNVFSVSSGNITAVGFSAQSSGTSIFCLGGVKRNCADNQNYLTADFTTGKFAFNTDGFNGITFTALDPTPVPFSFADGSVAITFLGSFWGLNKLRQAVSKRKALLPQ